MIKTEFVALCQEKTSQQKAAAYSAHIQKQRKRNKTKKAVLGIFLAAFFMVSCGIVGENDLKTEIAEEGTVERDTLSRNGEILYEDLIITEDGYRWKATARFPKGTEVVVLFDDNGTANPIDDIVLEVKER